MSWFHFDNDLSFASNSLPYAIFLKYSFASGEKSFVSYPPEPTDVSSLTGFLIYLETSSLRSENSCLIPLLTSLLTKKQYTLKIAIETTNNFFIIFLGGLNEYSTKIQN